MPERYRKKPVVIEAMQWDGTRLSIETVCAWVNSCPPGPVPEGEEPDDEPVLTYNCTTADDVMDVQIGTLEGYLSVSPGDWVIRGVQGEFYPCKPDIFEATYEPAFNVVAGTGRIALERHRQIEAEGWTAAHDDEHDRGELLLAAWVYLTEQEPFGGDGCGDEPPEAWPWDASWWKPSPDPIANLVKAGALIAAEIDRLQRAGASDG